MPPDCAGGILAGSMGRPARGMRGATTRERCRRRLLHAQASPKVVQRGEAQDKSSEHKERRGEQRGLTPVWLIRGSAIFVNKTRLSAWQLSFKSPRLLQCPAVAG